jgi:hypothetical protein
VLEAENLLIPNLETKPDEYDSYQCTMSAKFKEIAKEELREDESVRTQALTQFREWIAKHPNIKKVCFNSFKALKRLKLIFFIVPN